MIKLKLQLCIERNQFRMDLDRIWHLKIVTITAEWFYFVNVILYDRRDNCNKEKFVAKANSKYLSSYANCAALCVVL